MIFHRSCQSCELISRDGNTCFSELGKIYFFTGTHQYWALIPASIHPKLLVRRHFFSHFLNSSKNGKTSLTCSAVRKAAIGFLTNRHPLRLFSQLSIGGQLLICPHLLDWSGGQSHTFFMAIQVRGRFWSPCFLSMFSCVPPSESGPLVLLNRAQPAFLSIPKSPLEPMHSHVKCCLGAVGIFLFVIPNYR